MADSKKITKIEEKIKDGSRLVYAINGSEGLAIERYTGFFSMYWPTSYAFEDMTGLITERGWAEPSDKTTYYLKSEGVHRSGVLKDILSNSKGKDCVFFGVTHKDFDIFWEGWDDPCVITVRCKKIEKDLILPLFRTTSQLSFDIQPILPTNLSAYY